MLAATAEPQTAVHAPRRRAADRRDGRARRRDVGDPRARRPARAAAPRGWAGRRRTLVQAPRADSYTSDVLTQQQRDEASAAVEPQYDFTSAGAAAVATQQLRELDTQGRAGRGRVRRGRHARGPGAHPPDDAPGAQRRTTGRRSTGLDTRALGRRSAPRRRACSRPSSGPSSGTARSPAISESVAGRMAGDLNADERALAAALIAPLVAPNSSFSADAHRAGEGPGGRGRRAGHQELGARRDHRPQRRPRGRRRVRGDRLLRPQRGRPRRRPPAAASSSCRSS